MPFPHEGPQSGLHVHVSAAMQQPSPQVETPVQSSEQLHSFSFPEHVESWQTEQRGTARAVPSRNGESEPRNGIGVQASGIMTLRDSTG